MKTRTPIRSISLWPGLAKAIAGKSVTRSRVKALILSGTVELPRNVQGPPLSRRALNHWTFAFLRLASEDLLLLCKILYVRQHNNLIAG